MCSPLNPLTCPSVIEYVTSGAAGAAKSATDGAITVMLLAVNDQLHAGVKALAITLAGWLLVPSTELCPGSGNPGTGWMAACNTAASPATQLRSWMLPVTVLVAVLGLLWQAITLTITRKGEPLLQAIRGLATTALWGAVGIVGTQLALRASDSYTYWILKQSIFGNSANPVDTLGTALGDLSPAESYNALILLLCFYLPIMFITVAQIVLMVFREGSVVLLAGLLQLAAAGSFTRLTAGWLPKITGWTLALVAYKPIAASVYATAFALMGNDGMRNSIMGLAVMILAIVAMPATMKFFNWTVGSLATQSSAMGMIGSAAAAGVHAASSLRGIGGNRASDHATYMDDHGPGGGGAGAGGPTGAEDGGGLPGADTMRPSMPSPTAPTGSTTASSSSAGSAAAGAGTSAAAGAATGGVSVAAQAGAEAVGKVRQAAQSAADTAGDAMQGR
jgi:hypothetical protein